MPSQPPSPSRRDFLATSAAAFIAGSTAAGGLSLLPEQVAAATGDAAIRPFHVNFPNKALVDLRRRVVATKWPEREKRHGRYARRAARDDADSSHIIGRPSTTGANARRR